MGGLCRGTRRLPPPGILPVSRYMRIRLDDGRVDRLQGDGIVGLPELRGEGWVDLEMKEEYPLGIDEV